MFVRGAAEWIPRLHEHHLVLWCKVDARNTVHVRWLRGCGFAQTGVLEAFGVERQRFLCFARAATSSGPPRQG